MELFLVIRIPFLMWTLIGKKGKGPGEDQALKFTAPSNAMAKVILPYTFHRYYVNWQMWINIFFFANMELFLVISIPFLLWTLDGKKVRTVGGPGEDQALKLISPSNAMVKAIF